MNSKTIATICGALILTATVSGTTAPSAHALWPFSKSKSGEKREGFLSKLIRKRRPIAASQVGLVPGNPPAMYWKTADKPRAALLCLHEIGLYGGVFDDLGQRMAKQGVATYAIDLRGFGGWRDVSGSDSKMNLDNTLADVKGSVEIMRKLHPGIPVFVLGEAMGGALALNAAASFPDLIAGVISAAPGGEHFETGKSYMSVATGMIAHPNKDAGQSLRFMEMGTPKEELRTAFQGDDMVRLDVTPKELMDCQFFMYKTRQFARKITDTPVLLVHGTQDKMSRPEGSQKVYETLVTKDKAILNVDDGEHYLFEDTKVSDKAVDKTLAWIDQHLDPKRSQPQ